MAPFYCFEDSSPSLVPTMNMVRGITRLMSSLMNIFLRWYMFNVSFLQYNVSFMLYCVVISLQQCLWNLNFTPQNEGLDGGFGLPKPCKRFDIPRGEGCSWVVVALNQLVTFLQKHFSASYYVLSLFPGHPFWFYCVILKKMMLFSFVPVFIVFGQN